VKNGKEEFDLFADASFLSSSWPVQLQISHGYRPFPPVAQTQVATVTRDFQLFNTGAKKWLRLVTNGYAPALRGGQYKGFGLHMGSTAFWVVFVRAVRFAKAGLLVVYFPQ
jgi:hypothetical protein